MTKQFLTVYDADSAGAEKKPPMIKTYSFTTDDDDAATTVDNVATVSNYNKLLSINSPSIDSVNNDDDLSETSNKTKKRKPRKSAESEKKLEHRRLSIKPNPWYKKIDISKPLLIVGILIFLYLIWAKQDLWIPRLLTSNARVRRYAAEKVTPTSKESIESSSDISSTTTVIPLEMSSPTSPHQDDNAQNTEEYNDDENSNKRTNGEDDEDSTTSSSKSSTAHKMNIRVRRNKVRFRKELPKKKSQRYHDLSADDDVNETDDLEEDKLIQANLDISLTSTSPLKRQHRTVIQNENSKSVSHFNTGLRLSTYGDMVDQLRKALRSRDRERGREFLSTLSKTSGLSKDQLHRFIYKKDYHLLTLETFTALLDTFNLMLLIVPK